MAAFAQSNEGDVSPNTKGARCIDTGKKCDFNSSTCNGRVSPWGTHESRLVIHVSCLPPLQNELCIAAGPGKDMFDSTMIIAQKQYEAGRVGYRSL